MVLQSKFGWLGLLRLEAIFSRKQIKSAVEFISTETVRHRADLGSSSLLETQLFLQTHLFILDLPCRVHKAHINCKFQKGRYAAGWILPPPVKAEAAASQSELITYGWIGCSGKPERAGEPKIPLSCLIPLMGGFR